MCVDSFEAGYSRTLVDIDRQLQGITGDIKTKFPGGLESEVAEAYEERVGRLLTETLEKRIEELRTIKQFLGPRE